MNTNLKKLLPLTIVGVLSGATTFGAIHYFDHDANKQDYSYFQSSKTNGQFASFNTAGIGEDFVKASKLTVPAVVSIKKYSDRTATRASDDDMFEWFFGQGMQQQKQKVQPPKNMPSGIGSGVIISPDGYIISNNHVVEGANKLEVVLSNKKSYIATLIGTDPTTDIALLKIEEKGLPFLNFANSDMVDVGQWVLAVGNPLGLNSTVTAGIVSAKGRSIDLLSKNTKNPIESFIQTDAAINPGNSGGALVNTNGDLVGINSAISSNTGYYEGYGFAVPSNLARKVVEDIKKFGLVQRGFLGVGTLDLSDDQQVANYNNQKKTNIKAGNGILVTEVTDNSGAEDAGIKNGDIITKINDELITSYSDLAVATASRRPGDQVKVSFLRNGKENIANVTLKDQKGGTSSRSKADLSVAEKLGADFEAIDQKVKTYYGIDNGVVAKNVADGSELSKINVSEGNIIFEINGKPVNNQKEIEKILTNYKGVVSVKYLDDNGRITSRGFTMP